MIYSATKSKTSLWRWLPLLFIVFGLVSFFYFHLYQYLNFHHLKEHKQTIVAWTAANYKLAVGLYMLFYIATVSMSIPGNFIFAMTGGMLFGLWQGLLYALISATIGSVFIFLAIKLAFSDWFKQRTDRWIAKMEQGFNQNAFNYIVVLRLIPIFPFWLVNIVAAILGVRTVVFGLGTLLGIIPLMTVYVSLGRHLSQIIDSDQAIGLNLFAQPGIILPLMGLAVLALLPVGYNRLKKKSR
jgi:uncharacterized membrane protein YdjX (TVP38/TMEM64 family)